MDEQEEQDKINAYADAMIRRDRRDGWPVNRQPSDHDLACAARGRYEGPITVLPKERK